VGGGGGGGGIALVLNEVPPTGWLQCPARDWLPRGPVRDWYRLRPVAVLPWLFAIALVWYALPRNGFFPTPGSIIKAHYLEMVEHAKVALGLYWLCVTAFFLVRAIRRPRGTPDRLAQVLLALPLMGFAAGYGLLELHIVSLDGPLPIAAGVCWLLALLLAAICHGGQELRFPLVGIALSILVVLPLACLDAKTLWPFWEDLGQVRTADGGTYHAQRKVVFQGRSVALTEEVTRGPLFLYTRVIGVGSDTSHWGGYPILVRPRRAEGPASARGHMELMASPDDHWLALLRQSYLDNCPEAILVYNRRERKLYPRDETSTLSLFLLIGPEDELDPDDVAALRDPESARHPSAETIERDLKHPNPRVRALVAGLLADRPTP